jgi:hypothetical protein
MVEALTVYAVILKQVTCNENEYSFGRWFSLTWFVMAIQQLCRCYCVIGDGGLTDEERSLVKIKFENAGLVKF